MERNEEEFIEKLNNIKGQSLTYKKLCDILIHCLLLKKQQNQDHQQPWQSSIHLHQLLLHSLDTDGLLPVP